MKASVLGGVGQKLMLQDVPDLIAGPGEAVVKVVASAVNRRDLWIRLGKYAGLKFPIVLGSDAVGTPVSLGEGVEDRWNGARVIIDPSLYWGPSERYQDPKNFQILGLPEDGTFAEFVKVPAENLHLAPNYLSETEAAAIPLAGVTAFRALTSRAGLEPGEKVLVTGVGSGAATFAVQIATAIGATVHVTSSDPEKIERAVSLGARSGENYREEGWADRLKEATGGFDVIIDSAGGDEFSRLIDIANPGGRIVFFGATAGVPPILESRKVFWKQLSLLGTTMGSPSDFQKMIGFFQAHQIRPVVDRIFPLSEANEAVDAMESASRMGKIVVSVP